MPVVTVVEGVADDYELELEVDSLIPLPIKQVPVFVTLTRYETTLRCESEVGVFRSSCITVLSD
jgi:hypothetical protein